MSYMTRIRQPVMVLLVLMLAFGAGEIVAPVPFIEHFPLPFLDAQSYGYPFHKPGKYGDIINVFH